MSTANAALLATVTDPHRENPSNKTLMTSGEGANASSIWKLMETLISNRNEETFSNGQVLCSGSLLQE